MVCMFDLLRNDSKTERVKPLIGEGPNIKLGAAGPVSCVVERMVTSGA